MVMCSFMEDKMEEERLTWEEIKKKYPNQYVELKEVEYRQPNNYSVISGVVVSADDEKVFHSLMGYHLYEYTTPNENTLFFGGTILVNNE